MSAVLGRTFAAVVFDWDGTAVPDRRANAGALRRLVHELTAWGVEVVVVSGTHVGNIDGQLGARPAGPGGLHLCLNRGSQVYRVGCDGPALLQQRSASPDEEGALDRAATAAVAELRRHGLPVEVVSSRLNRRKLDLLPEPAWRDPPKAQFAQLVRVVQERLLGSGIDGLGAAVDLARQAARDAGLTDARVTTDAKHVEIGLTDKSDSMHWAISHLRSLGITGELVLVVGDETGPVGGAVGSDGLLLVEGAERAVVVSVGVEPEGVPAGVLHVGGGPTRFLEILREQRDRHRACLVPDVDQDERWVLRLPLDPLLQRVQESLLTLSDGVFGTRGSLEEVGEGRPSVLAAGVYDGNDSDEHLLPGPLWTVVGRPHPPAPAPADVRVLDLRTGVLVRATSDAQGERRSTRFACVARPGVVALRCQAPAGGRPGPPLSGPAVARDADGVWWARVRGSSRAGITAAGSQRVRPARAGLPWRLERVCAYVADPQGPAPDRAAAQALRAAQAKGFPLLLREQRAAWAERWADAAASVHGDADSERALRFALFHLLGSAAAGPEAAVAARGTTGPAYSGHVFWDADVFVLPALTAVAPPAARALLGYRHRRLGAAMARARAEGRRGARFPWESASEGLEVAPRWVSSGLGRVPVLTGQLEEHVVADVAWAALHYGSWSGDTAFLAREGRELLLETARYWASRCERDADGSAHLRKVIGPDEYHVDVDDNAYTNVMARWNLRQGAAALGPGDAEAASWRDLADRLVDGFDPSTLCYEQFTGYDGLEPIRLDALAPPPVAADLVLGPERVAASQVIKQPDVLMLHLLVPEEVDPLSLVPNLERYDPFTAHGSSLSPAVQAALLARAGRADEALRWFRIAARMDLDDLTGTTAAGLHLATMGGLWLALVLGFLGLRNDSGLLRLTPCLPSSWEQVQVRLRFRGRRVGLRVGPDQAHLEADGPVRVSGSAGREVSGRSCVVTRYDGDWVAGPA